MYELPSPEAGLAHSMGDLLIVDQAVGEAMNNHLKAHVPLCMNAQTCPQF